MTDTHRWTVHHVVGDDRIEVCSATKRFAVSAERAANRCRGPRCPEDAVLEVHELRTDGSTIITTHDPMVHA